MLGALTQITLLGIGLIHYDEGVSKAIAHLLMEICKLIRTL